MRDATLYHVAPSSSGSKWLVTIEDDDEFREQHDTKEKAVEAANAHARVRKPSQVKVHESDGDMEYEYTCG